MPNLLPPRPGGTLAAIAACPDADVIFVAHAGLDNIVSIRDVWRNFPIDQLIKARWWRVPHDAVPRTATHDAQVQWLYDWWKLIDSWITENRPGGVVVPDGVPEPANDAAEPVTELSALAILHTVGEPTPGNRGEPEYRTLTVLGVTDKDMAGLVGHLDAVAGRGIGALDPFQ